MTYDMQRVRTSCGDSSQKEVVEIPLSMVGPNRLGVRSSLGDLDALRESIVRYGLLSPILVRETGPSRYEVVAGNRRLRACESLGLPTIAANIIEANDKECFEIFLTENVQRDTLDPLDEARAFYSYISSEGRHGLGYGSVSELARKIGKSQEYVSNRMGLLRIPEPILRQLLGNGRLTVSHVEELASLSDNPTAVKQLANLAVSQKVSVRVLEKAVQFVKEGVETERALELARIESDMRVESLKMAPGSDRVNVLLRRTKKVLESTLAYLDNTSPEIRAETAVYEYWLENVRLPIHHAIDGAIVCLKKSASPKTSAQSRLERRGGRSPS